MNTIALIGVGAWALKRNRKSDAIMAGILSTLSFIWWASSETVPSWWSNILPFVLVLLVLVFFAQRLRMPAALGQPFRRGDT